MLADRGGCAENRAHAGAQFVRLGSRIDGIAADDFAAIYSLSRLARPRDGTAEGEETQHILEFYHRLTRDAATDVIVRWRRDVEYQQAIRDLELGTA